MMMAQRPRWSDGKFGQAARRLFAALVLVTLVMMGTEAFRPASLRAQSAPLFDVFISRQTDPVRVYFVDARTGLSVEVMAAGTGHTLLRDGVLYQDSTSGLARLAYPDGQIGIFAVIPPPTPDIAVRYAASPGGGRIAWSVTQRAAQAPLNTVSRLYVSDATGANAREVLYSSSTQGIGILPLTISDDGTSAFYARRNDLFELPAGTPLDLLVAEIFRLDTASGGTVALPTLPNCPCLWSIRPDTGWMARLAPTLNSFHFWDVSVERAEGIQVSIPPIELPIVSTLGLLQSPDGDRAVYTIAYTSRRATLYAIVLAESGSGTQRVIADNLDIPVHAVAFLPSGPNAARSGADWSLILVGPDDEGTFKLTIGADNGSGTLSRVSPFTYLGQVQLR